MHATRRFIISLVSLTFSTLAGACASARNGRSWYRQMSERVSRTISGRVVDRGGRPIESAEVRALNSWSGDLLTQSRTDSNGIFTIQICGLNPGVAMEFRAAHHASKIYDNFHPGNADHWFGDVLLENPASVNGLVLGADGKPLNNIEIFALRAVYPPSAIGEVAFVRKTRSNASGEFYFNDLPAEKIHIGGGSKELGDALIVADPPEGGVENVILQLPAGAAVRGRVVDTGGKPVANANVDLNGRQMIAPWRQPCVSDSNGYFTIWPMPGQYDPYHGIQAMALTGICYKEWDDFVANPVLTLPAKPEFTTLLVRIPEESLLPENPVVWADFVDSAGTPLSKAGLEVLILRNFTYPIATISLGQPFPFQGPTRKYINCELENFRIVLRAGNGGIFMTDVFASVPAPSDSLPVFTANPILTKTVELQILDDAGLPVSNFPLTGKLWGRSGQISEQERTTNKKGVVLFQIEETPEHYFDLDVSGGTRDLVLPRVRVDTRTITKTHIPFLIAKRGARISGSVTVDGQKPSQPVFVRIESCEIYNQDHTPVFYPEFASTDSDGNFYSNSLPPGKVRLSAFTPEPRLRSFESRVPAQFHEFIIGSENINNLQIDVPLDRCATVAVSARNENLMY